MPDDIQPKDKAKAEEIAEANKRERRDALNEIFDRYVEVIGKVSEASALLVQVVEKIVALDKLIRKFDSSGDTKLFRQQDSGDLRLAHNLRVKVIMGIAFPARQHLDRLIVLMKARASSREDMLAEDERRKPVFE